MSTEINKLTWISPNRNAKNQIDNALVNGHWKHSIHDITVKRSGADVGSDHHFVLLYNNCQTTARKKSRQGGREDAKVEHC